MDNLCHTLTGWTIARAGIERLSLWATATCIIAANLPDLDLIWASQNELLYLEQHRGITHSAIGLLVQTVLLAAAVRGINWIKTRGNSATRAANFGGLLVASGAGLASHLLLDWTNSYGVRPWLPFDRTWYYADLVFVVDPWLWLLFAAALFLGAPKNLSNSKRWLALFALLAAAIAAAWAVLAPGELGFAPPLWFGFLAAIILAKWRKPNWNKTTLASGAITGYLFYLIALAALHQQAISAAHIADAGEPTQIEKINANPLLMRPDRWNIFVQTPDRIFNAQSDLSGSHSAIAVFDRHLNDSAAQAALQTCPGKVAAGFSRYLRVEIVNQESVWTVNFIDERFPIQNGRRAVGQVAVKLNSDLSALPDARICPKF